mgnify:CR=1 FL=1
MALATLAGASAVKASEGEAAPEMKLNAATAAEIAENPRAVIGGNAPPEPTPFDLVCENVESVYLEAKNWLDGAAIETQNGRKQAV